MSGPHTGRKLAALPVDDLGKPGCGAWRGSVNWKASGMTTLPNTPPGAGAVLKAFHRKGSGTSAHPHTDANGIRVVSQHPAIAGQQSVVVSFDLYFDPNRWHWSRGGKLGGLFVGQGKASGGRHVSDGASHRIMFQANGGAISYCYFPAGVPQPNVQTKGNAMGEGYHHQLFKGAFTPGTWHRVQIGLKNNTFVDGKPAADGAAMLTIDGKTGMLRGVNWSATPGTTLESFELSSFFGGPAPAVVDSVFYARNFSVHEWKDA